MTVRLFNTNILSGWILAPYKPSKAFYFLDRDLTEV